MWEHYKSTFLGMQLMILVVTAAIYFFFGHILAMAAVFFVVMQVGSLFGAVWAARLRRRMADAADRLPVKGSA